MSQHGHRCLAAAICLFLSPVLPFAAGAETPTELNAYGMPGLIDMPTAAAMPDADLAITSSYFKGQRRNTLAFQISPRLTGSFRYSIIENYSLAVPPVAGVTRFDRSFDLHYLISEESLNLPAVAVGIRDLVGTGVYSGEYLVATKSIGPNFTFTGGIGWGRLGSYGSFENPLGIFSDAFNTRPVGFVRGEAGGDANLKQIFRGPAALFGGVRWKASDRLSLLAEYSSDAYPVETEAGNFERKSPLNFGLIYSPTPGIQLGASYMYGSEIGVSASFALNPKRPIISDRSPAPIPVRVRTGDAASWSQDWVTDTAGQDALRATVAQALALDGIVVERFELTGDAVFLRFRNTRYQNQPQAMGHVARILTVLLPPSVEALHLEPSVEGMTTARVTLQRSDLEQLENDPDGAWSSFVRAEIEDPGRQPTMDAASLPPPKRLTWSIGPYYSSAMFDPVNPLRYELGAQLNVRYDFLPGLSISGIARQKVFGNKDEANRAPQSDLPLVRSDAYLYDKNDSVVLERLTMDYFTRPGRNLYARLSFGYLESMYGGASAELLWKPVRSRLALGLEANYAVKRDYDKGFGFQDYATFTGHASAYYDLGKGYDAQIDIGRYLAGDIGATVSLDRTFANGWKIGAYATITDVPFETFGEGSFDKGIRLTIPLTWATGKPSKREFTGLIQPILRDGGARLFIANRLYDQVRGDHTDDLRDQWGQFWR